MNTSETLSAPEQIARRLLGGLALLGLLIGQILLYVQPKGLEAGLSVSSVALLAFIWFRVRRPPAVIVKIVVRLRLSTRTLLLGAALVLSIATAAFDFQFEQQTNNFLLVWLLWIGSLAAILLAFGVQLPADWRQRLKDHRGELVVIGLVTLGAAALRFYQLGALPRVINGDDGVVGQFALAADRFPLTNPFALSDNFGSLYLHIIAFALQSFGRTLFGLRLIPTIGGILAIPALYLLARRLFNRRVALVAVILLALAHAHIQFSRTVAVAYIQAAWLGPLELYFFITAIERRSLRRAAIGGVLLGLHFSIYITAQIIIALLVVYLLILALINRPLLRGAGRAIAAFAIAVGLTALPQIAYNARHIAEFMARLNADGTFQSGWLVNEMAQRGLSAFSILAERVAHVFLSLNYFPAYEFYGVNVPVLDVLTSVLFIIGLGYALWRTRDHHYLLLNGYFWSFIVAIGVFSIPPGADSYRVSAALPAVILLAAVGFDQVLAILDLKLPDRRATRLSGSIGILVLIGLLNIQTYYGDFAGHCLYGGGTTTRFASYLGQYLGTLKPETTVYLLSTDEVAYGTHPSVDFLSGGLPVTNWPTAVDGVSIGPATVVIAPPARLNELLAWSRNHTSGTLQSEYDCGNLILMAYRTTH